MSPLLPSIWIGTLFNRERSCSDLGSVFESKENQLYSIDVVEAVQSQDQAVLCTARGGLLVYPIC